MKQLWILVLLSAGCATFTPRRSIKPRLLPMCSTPQLVLIASDVPSELATATEIAIREWNEAAGRPVFAFVAGAEFTSSTDLGSVPFVSVHAAPLSAADDPDHRGRTRQSWRKGCSQGARVVVYLYEGIEPQTIQYSIKHELGHALGLGHGYWGVMRAEIPAWLPDYYFSAGRIQPEDRSDLRKLYPYN